MPRDPNDETGPEPTELPDPDEAYEVPPEIEETGLDEGGGPEGARPRAAVLKLAAAAALVLVLGGALLVYRAHHRKKAVAEGLAQADVLLRLDTAAGYREAASLLVPIAQLDPREAASVRAFALAMLFTDYRATAAEAEAEALLLEPGRLERVPLHAHLAAAALALGRREVGSATTAATRAGDGPWARALQARIAFQAGNPAAALESAAASAATGPFPPGLALHGDALRRTRKDAAAARAAYEAALDVSPRHPRAVFGLAKLALSGKAPAEKAIAALERLANDGGGSAQDPLGTPGPERARAALHLASLRIRGSDREGAERALDAAGLDAASRAWARKAAVAAADHRGWYRAVSGAPAALQSASDDDPGELSPEPPPPPPTVAPKVAPKKAAVKKAPAKRSPAKKPSRRTRR